MSKESPVDTQVTNPSEVQDTPTAPVESNPTPTPQETPTGSLLSVESIAGAHLDTHPGFDAAIHAVEADGSPKKKADGSYALKRGRKAGGASPLPPKTPRAASPAAPAPQSQTISPDEAARQSANLVINAAVWICGEEIGAPSDKAEAEGLLFSFKNYYAARGVPNIPPEMGLVLGIGSYVVPRLRAIEKKEGKISKWITALKIKIAEMRG